MRQVAGLIGTYSSDEFGICSALFELGGMVVMHDASGCNSTYTTHDEPRWYDVDSMIFISAISEMEAIMGDDDKLIDDIIETANDLSPAFIAIVGAPIPYMIGTDLTAIAAIVEHKTSIPCIGFAANGMQHYTKGISMAMEALVERFCIQNVKKTSRLSVNLIGATPLDFSMNGSIDSIRDWLDEQDMEFGVCMAMGSSLDQIREAGKAHVNLVLSYGGLAAAKKLQEQFGTPYVVGVPFGQIFAKHLGEDVKRAAHTGESMIGYQNIPNKTKTLTKTIKIIGESVYSCSLAATIELEYDIKIQVLCPLDTEVMLLREGDQITPDEDDLIEHLADAAGMIADPMYQPICPQNTDFYPLPHEAFSGRIYDPVNPNLINRKFTIDGSIRTSTGRDSKC